MEKGSGLNGGDGLREKMKLKEAAQCRKADGAGKEKNTLALHDPNPEAPDGGWGWMVVLGAFVTGLVSAGFTSLISVLYVEWITYFDVSASELSWIGFLFPGTAGFVSIVIGKIWTSFGVRSTAIVGAFLSAAGCLGGSFSTKPYHIAISIGVVSGVGVGLVFISSVNMVAVYFHKRFGVANGIMFLGTSLSQIGVPPLTRFLVSWYGWRGALQITSAIMCHSVAAACLLRPLKPARKKTGSSSSSLSGACDNKGFNTTDIIELDALPQLSTPLGTPVIQRRRRIINGDNTMDEVNVFVGGAGTLMRTDSLNRGRVGHQRGERPNELDRRLMQVQSPASGHDNCNQNAHPVSVNIPTIKVEDCDRDAKVERGSHKEKDCPLDTKTGNGGVGDESGRTESRCDKVCKNLADMFGITLFRHEPLAILQNFSSMVVMIGTFPPVAHVMAMATGRGMAPSDAAALLSVLGVGGTIGRILSGVIIDKQLIGPHCYMTIINVLTAIPIAVLPIFASVFSHAAATLFFAGVGIGSTIVLRIVQAKKVVAPAFMSDNVRIVVMTTGIGMTIGAVLSGWLSDLTGSYSVSFYFTADILLFGAAINLTLSVLTRRSRKKLNSLQPSV